jgi:simple sugar transport system ATP-binding protein
MAVSSRVTVLRRGTNVATVATADSTLQSLAALMVGREVHQLRREARPGPPGEVALALDDVSVTGDRGGLAVKGVSFQIREGEVLGIAGVAGNGQRELAEAVYGIRDLASGSVRVAGRELHHGDPRSAIAAGVAHIPEDRLGTGLAPSLSISRNVALKRYRSAPVSRGPLVLAGRMRELALSLIKRYDVQAPGPETPARNLSGGNLQKLVLGREFEGEPRVLIASQPTRGLDVGAIETVHGYLRDASAHGVAVLMISEDLDELMALSDRILVMYEGEVAGEVSPETASIEEIGLLMAGGDS